MGPDRVVSEGATYGMQHHTQDRFVHTVQCCSVIITMPSLAPIACIMWRIPIDCGSGSETMESEDWDRDGRRRPEENPFGCALQKF